MAIKPKTTRGKPAAKKPAAKKKATAKKPTAKGHASTRRNEPEAKKKKEGPPNAREFAVQVAATLGDGFSIQQVLRVLEQTRKVAVTNTRRWGKVKIPHIAMVTMKTKPARAGYQGINPFTKQEQYFPPKPASRTVKLRPAKELRTL